MSLNKRIIIDKEVLWNIENIASITIKHLERFLDVITHKELNK